MSFGEGNLHEEVRRLRLENAELRGLAADMLGELGAVKEDVFLWSYIEEKARELGIEGGMR